MGIGTPLLPGRFVRIRRYSPGPITPDSGTTREAMKPVALEPSEYCRLQPFTSTAVWERLKISMWSESNGAPALPPPPKNPLTTMREAESLHVATRSATDDESERNCASLNVMGTSFTPWLTLPGIA